MVGSVPFSGSLILFEFCGIRYIYDMINIYVNKDYKEGHGKYPNTLDDFKNSLVDGMINEDVSKDLADDMFRLSNISDNQTNEIIDFLSPSNIGNIASIAGLVVAFIPGAGEVGFICTVIGGGAAIASIDNSLAITEPTTDELKTIFIQGQLNMSIDTTSGTVPGESHEIYSTRYNAWEEKCYINKYYDPVRHLKKWDTFIIFTDLYEIEEKGGQYDLIEKK